jgi:hypothetical protein
MRFLYYKIVPYHWRPKNIWYALKCKFWHRYTTIKPRGLSHEWLDRDLLLLHMIFEILCQFVEKELIPSEGQINWESDEEHKFAKKEMLELYHWWLNEYDEDYPFNLPEDQLNKIENKWQAECDYRGIVRRNCKRVIDISSYMWT